MPNINKNEYGQTLRVNLGEDISTATDYILIIEPKYGEELEKTGVLGVVNVVEGDETYLANEYITYVTSDGDIDKAGQWRVKGQADLSATNRVISDYKYFTVLE